MLISFRRFLLIWLRCGSIFVVDTEVVKQIVKTQYYE